MKNKNLLYVLTSAVVMLLFPYLAVTFVKGDGGMAICFILFFVINPIWSVFVGLFAGKNIKTSWFQPLILAALFLAGTWLQFDMGESAFLIYMLAYFAIAVVIMLVKSLVDKRK